ncbi:MAG: YIP1 family protein [Proteobacteria bacterium]|nr:YIP1 family protein [Pseudomonadota bacterium]
MIIKKYLLAIFSPRAMRELSLNQSIFTAVAINAINGALMMTFLFLRTSFVSVPFALLLGALFGPLMGIIITLIYPRIELWVGQKLGGKASFDDLYRIFAWSFLPAALAKVLTDLVIKLYLPTTITMNKNVSIDVFIYTPLCIFLLKLCFLIILCFAIRNYCSNVISAHQLSKTKGIMSVLITFILFVIIPSWLIVVFSIFLKFIKKCCSGYSRSGYKDDNDIARTGVKRFGIAIVLFYVALFSWIILYDEKPDSLMMEDLNAPVPEVLQVDNAWIALLGFTSPSGGPPFVKEEEILRNLKTAAIKGDINTCKKLASANKNKVFFTPPSERPKRRRSSTISRTSSVPAPNSRPTNRLSNRKKTRSSRVRMPEFYVRKDNGILDYVLANHNEVDSLLQNNKELLGRYDKLYNFHKYVEPLEYSFCTPALDFSTIRNIHKVKLMQIALFAQHGDLSSALNSIQNDAEFWRFIAINTKTLLPKLYSYSILSTDIRFVAELCSRHSLNFKQQKTVEMILRPFDQNATSLTKALHGETYFWIFGMDLLHRSKTKWPPTNLLKQNATRNRYFSLYQKEIELSEMTPQKFAAEVARNGFANTDKQVKFSFLYNPVGEILASITEPDISKFIGYIDKGYNLEGLRRLATLKVLSSTENIAPENMQQFLDTHKGEFGNPYTGEPMIWDSKVKRIYFKPVQQNKPVEIFM